VSGKVNYYVSKSE
jgi:hypothetical protein